MKKVLVFIALCFVFIANAQLRQVNGWGNFNGLVGFFYEFNGKLFFVAKTGSLGNPTRQVFSSDGTTAGLQSITANSISIFNNTPSISFNTFNSELFFDGATTTSVTNIYKLANTSGVQANIAMNVTNFSNSSMSRFNDSEIINNKIIFSPYSSNSSQGVEPYVIDLNNSANNGILKDIYPGNSNSNPILFTAFNNAIYFVATDPTYGRELWKTDGTSSGTSLFMDLNIGIDDGSPDQFNILGSQLTFVATEGSLGRELFKTSGNTGSLVLIKDINPNVGSSSPSNVTKIDQELYFSAHNGVNGYEFWISNGTNFGTNMIKDINPSGDSNPKNFTKLGNEVFFTADDGVNGVELWKTDGTTNGTVMVKNIRTGVTGSNPSSLTVYNGKLYFIAEDDSFYRNLWVSDGTTSGTLPITSIVSTSVGVNPNSGLFLYANELYFGFSPSSTSGVMLYAYKDPTLATESFQLNDSKIMIYPNPTKNYFELTAEVVIEKVEMYSLQGQLVKTFKYQNLFDISDVAKGVYVLKIVTDKGIQNKKLIIE